MGVSFKPLLFLGNPHLQTLVASFVSLATEPASVREAVCLGDGDRLALEISTPEGWTKAAGTVVLIHGLSGDHRSSYMRRLATKLAGRGVRAVRLNMRDAGSGEGWARKPYHGGCSPDVLRVLEHLEPSGGAAHLWGFSLGGNVALKLAGELGAGASRLIRSVAAICPAADLPRCVERIMLPENRLYEWAFLRQLTAVAERRYERYPELERAVFPKKMRIIEFDELFVARIWNFASALDYYERASAKPHLEAIRVPTRIVLSEDDPIVCPSVLEGLALPADVTVRRMQKGGHLGFLGRSPDHGVQWMDQLLFEWLAELA